MGTIDNKRRCIVSRVLGIIAGIVMLIAAVGKMGDVGSFGELIIKYGLPALSILAPVVIAAEVLSGLMLLLWVWPRIAAVLTMVMLVVFTAAFFYANTWHGVTDCGCFGSFGPSAPAWIVYGRNVLLIVACVFVVLWGKGNAGIWRWIIVAVGMVVAAFCIGKSFRVPSYYSGLFGRRHPMIGLSVKNAGLDRYVDISADSTYVFYVFSYDCPACIDNLANAMRYDNRSVADRFCGLAVNEDRDSVVHKTYDIGFDEIFIGDGLQGKVEEIPALLYVEHDTVRYIIEGVVPSEMSFKRFYLEK